MVKERATTHIAKRVKRYLVVYAALVESWSLFCGVSYLVLNRWKTKVVLSMLLQQRPPGQRAYNVHWKFSLNKPEDFFLDTHGETSHLTYLLSLDLVLGRASTKYRNGLYIYWSGGDRDESKQRICYCKSGLQGRFLKFKTRLAFPILPHLYKNLEMRRVFDMQL